MLRAGVGVGLAVGLAAGGTHPEERVGHTDAGDAPSQHGAGPDASGVDPPDVHGTVERDAELPAADGPLSRDLRRVEVGSGDDDELRLPALVTRLSDPVPIATHLAHDPRQLDDVEPLARVG